MENKETQVLYWVNGSDSDLETSKLLLDNGKILHSLFFCHLSVEKLLKALVVKHTGDFAPKSHNIFFLAEKAKIELPDEFDNLSGILMKYQIEGRYPEYKPEIPDKQKKLQNIIFILLNLLHG